MSVSQSFPPNLSPTAKSPPKSAASAPVPKGSVKGWKVQDVCNWLSTLNLSQDYSKIFAKNAIDGDVLVTLTGEDIKELGITVFGDVRKLQKGIRDL
jgi:hypothetical protein